MATESVAIETNMADVLDDVQQRILEAVAIQEMATRVDGSNEEDFEMVRQACCVTFRLLEEAKQEIGRII